MKIDEQPIQRTDCGLIEEDLRVVLTHIRMMEAVLQKYETLIPNPPQEVKILNVQLKEHYYKVQAVLYPNW
jgi:hypothetical protein